MDNDHAAPDPAPSKLTPEQRARDDLLILHLKQAVELGYTMATPGSHHAVRDAFPDLFASEDDYADVPTTDDLEIDDYPMVSRGEGGHWVSCWSWVHAPDVDEEQDEDKPPQATDCLDPEDEFPPTHAKEGDDA